MVYMEFFRRRVLGETDKAQTEAPPLKVGYVNGVIIDSHRGIPVVRTMSSENPVLVSGNYINGDVPGTSIGLITTLHGNIDLLIDDPSKYLSFDEVRKRLEKRDYKKYRINPLAEGLPEFGKAVHLPLHSEILELNRARQDAIIEEINFGKEVSALSEQLARLKVEQTDQAKQVLSDFEKKKIQLKEAVRHTTQSQDEAEIKLMEILKAASKQLIIRSFNGDVVLNVQDPDLEVVIWDEFNHRDFMRKVDGGESVVVRGTPPSNPTRTAQVFTYRGRISVSYPNRE